MIDLLTVGEAMATFRTAGPMRIGGPTTASTAGAEANVAIGLSRLGHSARWVGVVGDDMLGALVLRTLRAEGVLVDAARVDPDRPTGVLIREVRVADVSRVMYVRKESAGSQVSAADVRAAADPPPRWVHVTGITPALGEAARTAVAAALQLAAASGARVSLDVNYRAALWSRTAAAAVLRDLAAHANVLVTSDDELALVAPPDAAGETEQIAALVEQGVAEVVIKRGASGASLHSTEGEWTMPARTVPIVDTVGAGDAFTAGYLSAALDGLAPPDRLRRAVTCGAFSVATDGDWEGLPDRDELALLDLEPGAAQR